MAPGPAEQQRPKTVQVVTGGLGLEADDQLDNHAIPRLGIALGACVPAVLRIVALAAHPPLRCSHAVAA